MTTQTRPVQPHMLRRMLGKAFGAPQYPLRIDARQAATLDDFMHLMRMMKQMARSESTPLDPYRIGTILSRLNHRGSGPNSGCAIIARDQDGPIGFALMLAKTEGRLELVWLHADDDDGRVMHALWQAALEINARWGLPPMQIGLFAPLPSPEAA